MINIIDLVLGAIILVYLLKNAGGLAKTAKNILVIIAMLVLYGVISVLVLSWPWTAKIHRPLEDSYLRRLSHAIVRVIYPAIEKSAPQVDTFIKKEIIAKPAPEIKTPTLAIPEKALPKLKLEDLPVKLK